jgi:hypothetical protein
MGRSHEVKDGGIVTGEVHPSWRPLATLREAQRHAPCLCGCLWKAGQPLPTPLERLCCRCLAREHPCGGDVDLGVREERVGHHLWPPKTTARRPPGRGAANPSREGGVGVGSTARLSGGGRGAKKRGEAGGAQIVGRSKGDAASGLASLQSQRPSPPSCCACRHIATSGHQERGNDSRWELHQATRQHEETRSQEIPFSSEDNTI